MDWDKSLFFSLDENLKWLGRAKIKDLLNNFVIKKRFVIKNKFAIKRYFGTLSRSKNLAKHRYNAQVKVFKSTNTTVKCK